MQPPTPTQSVSRRKTVTVLFCDLVESTSMAESTDPEALAEILAGYFASMRAIVERHGGIVEKFIGDAIVGMFGVPTAHEDDALRAVRAALEMRSAIDDPQSPWTQRYGVRLAARIGLNTGQVAATGRDTGDQLALGHAINLAARLEQAAETGEVLIGAETYALVDGDVEAERVGPLSVKGASSPIAAWRVTGLRPERPRGWQGGRAFVGRRRELSALAEAFESAVGESKALTVIVVGPPGIGKSRLIAEFVAGVEQGARIVVGRCAPYGEATTYRPIAEIIDQLAESAQGREQVDRARLLLASAVAGPGEVAWSFAQALEAVAASRPLVSIVEDLHWADALLLDLVELVAVSTIGRPILLLTTSRPDLFDTRPGWLAERPDTIVRLEPLTAEETATLLESSESADRDPSARERIVAASGGVPLFVEQMAAFDREGKGVVPPTIRALLAARVDRLRDDERAVLERAAVEGETFRKEVVESLSPAQVRDGVGPILAALSAREFVVPDMPAGEQPTFRFSHALIRDAVYEQTSRRLRSDLHARFADLLERDGGDGVDEIVGHHVELAYRERAALGGTDGDLAALAVRAGSALRLAGRRAVGRKQWSRAIDLLSRAAELLRSAPAERVRVWPDLITAYVGLPDLDAADRTHDLAIEECRALGDLSNELRADVEWSHTEYMLDAPGWPERVAALADRAVTHFTSLGDDSSVARALLRKATAQFVGELQPMIDTLRRAQAHAERAGDERVQIEVWDELGGAMLAGRTPYPEVREFMQRERAWAGERGIAFTEADASLGLAYAIVASGDWDAARDHLEQVHATFAALPGTVSQHGETFTLAGAMERDAGRYEEAAAHYRRAMELFDQAGQRRWWRTASSGLVHALLDLDRLDDAEELIGTLGKQESKAVSRLAATLLSARARLAAKRGDLEAAVELGREAVGLVAGSEAILQEARAREYLAEFLASAGKADASLRELERSAALYAAKGYLPGVERVRARLHRGHPMRADDPARRGGSNGTSGPQPPRARTTL